MTMPIFAPIFAHKWPLRAALVVLLWAGCQPSSDRATPTTPPQRRTLDGAVQAKPSSAATYPAGWPSPTGGLLESEKPLGNGRSVVLSWPRPIDVVLAEYRAGF